MDVQQKNHDAFIDQYHKIQEKFTFEEKLGGFIECEEDESDNDEEPDERITILEERNRKSILEKTVEELRQQMKIMQAKLEQQEATSRNTTRAQRDTVDFTIKSTTNAPGSPTNQPGSSFGIQQPRLVLNLNKPYHIKCPWY